MSEEAETPITDSPRRMSPRELSAAKRNRERNSPANQRARAQRDRDEVRNGIRGRTEAAVRNIGSR
ncbi:hypothetical protein ACFOVU_20800 [Nocardiopsis sediminis]|uniref:BZIP domain-containing protein n=1 Tax=Nocardiopsis sediminis TaxID=1778267 RepID=A0ABV8FQJ3_9ACTN